METGSTVRHVLEHAGVALCDSCLAFACDTSLTEIRPITDTLVRETAKFHRGSSCANCQRTVETTFYESASSDMSEKCVQCSQPVGAGETSLMFDGQRVHDSCLWHLLTDETIRASQAMNRRSRELIETSRRRLHYPPTYSESFGGQAS
jgi:hypothetical protein